jgi:hypothetical protein
VPFVAEGTEDVPSTRDVVVTAIDRLTDLVCAGFSASVTVAVKLAVPLVVGVPAMIPVAGTRVSPAGRLPVVIDQLYGPVPPVALRVAM